MNDDRRQVPHSSREEAQIAESILYGLLWQMLLLGRPMIEQSFELRDIQVSATDPADQAAGVHFDGLTISMASGDYAVTVKKVS